MKLKGGRELDAFLSAYPVKMQRNVMRGALRAGAKVIQKSAKQKVEKESGQTAKDIKIETDVRGGIPKARVKLKGPHAHVGYFLEHGVGQHLIARTGAKEGRVAVRKAAQGNGTVKNRPMKIGGDFVSGILSHPGLRPHPFMRPALDEKQGEAIAAVGEYVRKRMQIDISTLPPLEIDEDE